MIHTLWYEIMDDFPNVHLHEFVIIPNHIHGIIEIVGADSISALCQRSISAQIYMQKNIDYTVGVRVGYMVELRAEMDSAPTY